MWPDVREPAAGNDNWEFTVSVTLSDPNAAKKTVTWSLADTELRQIAKERLGRYLRHTGNPRDQIKDLTDNFELLSEDLNRKVGEWFESHPEQLNY
jgi:hypothetical protein